MSKPKVGTQLLPEELFNGTLTSPVFGESPIKNSFGSICALALGLDIGKCVFMHLNELFLDVCVFQLL